jgi:hypothetical protein
VERKAQAPGLRWHPKTGKPIWRASRAAIKVGYPVKNVSLATLAYDEAALEARCHRLQAEMNDWLAGRRGRKPLFDGTIGSLINFYQTDQASPYHNLEPASRHPYDVYARMIVGTVGKRRIDALDGRDLKRWWNEWSAPVSKQGGRPRLAAGRMAFIVLKTALAFGIACRKPGCAELKEIIRESRFIKAPPPRTEAPTADEVDAAIAAAHELGHPEVAFAYALQFEGSMRQWDVIGKWVPLSDQRPSSIIDGNKKWLGPMWSQVDENLILRYTPSKTQFTTGAKGTVDFPACPMVMTELAKVPDDARRGPLVINPQTGLPYTQRRYAEIWRKVADRAGIANTVWNRDLRAAAVTEAREGAAPTDDVAKVAAHSKRTTAKVYDRDSLEAHRRVMRARVARRNAENGK